MAEERKAAGTRRAPLLSPTLASNLRVFERWSDGLAAALVVVAIAYGVGIGDPARIVTSISVLLALLIAGALTGAMGGFIFAIPRLLARGGIPEGGVGTGQAGRGQNTEGGRRNLGRALAGNSNLEEVSDWVTKILVGLGLVNAKSGFDHLWAMAGHISSTGLAGAPGSDVVVFALGVAAVVWGFLFFYLQTRTRITLMLFAAEEFQNAGALPEADVTMANDAPITDEAFPFAAAVKARVGLPTAPAGPVEADAAILAHGFDDLTKPEEFAAWGSAQARAGNLEAAETALRQANALDPASPIVLRRLAEVRALRGDLRGAVENLREAAAKAPGDWRIRRRELFHSLYLRSPEGFTRALPISEELAAHVEGSKDALVHVWRACAHGQRHRWLSVGPGDRAGMDDSRREALASVRQAVAMAPDTAHEARKVLVRLLDPVRIAATGDDDLADFVSDPEFRTAIGVHPPGHTEADRAYATG